MRQGRYGLSVLVHNLMLNETMHSGKGYIAAPEGQDFSLQITTPDTRRYEVVLSVDGLSVMTGKDASTSERGYIFSEDTQYIIPGFRLNDSEVARFHFGDRSDSYASKLGKPKNIGVIGGVIYAEYVPPVSNFLGHESIDATPAAGAYYSANFASGASGSAGSGSTDSISSRSAPAGKRNTARGGATKGGVLRAASAASVGHDLGTEFGEKTQHVVGKTHFNRGAEVARFVLEYASYDSLVKAGILPYPPGFPVPFPADKKEVGCKPPAGWKG